MMEVDVCLMTLVMMTLKTQGNGMMNSNSRRCWVLELALEGMSLDLMDINLDVVAVNLAVEGVLYCCNMVKGAWMALWLSRQSDGGGDDEDGSDCDVDCKVLIMMLLLLAWWVDCCWLLCWLLWTMEGSRALRRVKSDPGDWQWLVMNLEDASSREEEVDKVICDLKHTRITKH